MTAAGGDRAGHDPAAACRATGSPAGATARRAARPSSRSSCCSGSTPSTSSAATRSASCCPTSATTSASARRGFSTVVAFGLVGGLILAVPIGFLADRFNRVHIIIIGGIVLGMFSVLTGFAVTILMLAIARAGAELGRGVNDPAHNSLLADYYDIGVRPRVYSVHRSANSVGQALGPLLGGSSPTCLGWRVPFIFFAIPTAIFVILAFRLREPIRGHYERGAMGATGGASPPRTRRRRSRSRGASSGASARCAASSTPCRSSPLAIRRVAELVSLFYDEVFGSTRCSGASSPRWQSPCSSSDCFIGIPIATRFDADATPIGAEVPRRRDWRDRGRLGCASQARTSLWRSA